MANRYRFDLRDDVTADAIDASPLQPAYLDRIDDPASLTTDADATATPLGDLFRITVTDDAAVPTLELTGETSRLHRIAAAADGMRNGLSRGRIVVHGDAGPMAGHRMRRGELFIDGDADRFLAASMIAGTIAVTGSIAGEPMLAARRGTLIHRHAFVAPPQRFTRPFPTDVTWLRLINVEGLPPRVATLLRPDRPRAARRRTAAAEVIRMDCGDA